LPPSPLFVVKEKLPLFPKSPTSTCIFFPVTFQEESVPLPHGWSPRICVKRLASSVADSVGCKLCPLSPFSLFQGHKHHSFPLRLSSAFRNTEEIYLFLSSLSCEGALFPFFSLLRLFLLPRLLQITFQCSPPFPFFPVFKVLLLFF